MKSSTRRNGIRCLRSYAVARIAAIGVIAVVLLAACFSPLQSEGGAAGIAVSLDFLGALDGSELGWVADIYVYSAGDLERIVDLDNNFIAQPRANAVPIPVGGESFLRQAFGSVDGVTPESGGGTVTRIRVSSVPAGGPYVLFVRIWDDLSTGTPVAEYFTGGWIPGAQPALSLNSFFVSAGATTTVPPSGFAEVIGPASTLPVGQWRFDEGAELVDATGNGNTLTQVGIQIEPPYSEEPENTGNFYPVLSQEDHGFAVQTPNNFAVGLGGHTYSLWFRNTNVDGNGFGTFGQQGTLIRRDRTEGAQSTDKMIFWLGAPTAANRLDMAINNWGVNVDVAYGSEGVLETGSWNMITVVLDYDMGTTTVYVNGASAWSGDTSFYFSEGGMHDPGPFYIGRYPNADGGNVVPADRSVFGHIDDVRIYRFPLSGEAVQTLYNDGRQ